MAVGYLVGLCFRGDFTGLSLSLGWDNRKKRIASRGLAQEEQWDLDVSQIEHGHPVAGMGMRNLCERKNKSVTVGKQ